MSAYPERGGSRRAALEETRVRALLAQAKAAGDKTQRIVEIPEHGIVNLDTGFWVDADGNPHGEEPRIVYDEEAAR